MLVIGHRGAAGLAPENSLASLQAGFDAGADMLEFDVRLTRDKVAILSHGARLHGKLVRLTKLDDLEAAGSVTTLDAILSTFFGRILLNLEIKPATDVKVIYQAIKKYVVTKEDWNNVLISSFHVRYLFKLRKLNRHLNLALLHSINPFAFVTYQRRLQLSAVGWHRLHVNSLCIQIAQKAGIFTYVYTVNRTEAAQIFSQKGIDGVVTDYPNQIASKT
ncbi:MAG: putative Glycerophosphoryl diester phosphodiesterase [Candidatus Saccharibacteria bacterium]|nr:putative Glycerophosphoryl diester phosphodiesterase [Candidatus Saccharibacteria bacterium]